MKKRFSFLSVVTAILVVFPGIAVAEQLLKGEGQDAQPQASILFFQDGHDIMPVKQGTKNDPTYHGGIARLATVLAQEKAAGVPTDIAFGGDLGGGTLFGAVFRGEAMVDGFNQLGVNIAGFGQHDFDYGVEQTLRNVQASNFPWVSSNLTYNGMPLADSTIIRQVGDVKIGYIGLTVGMETTTAGKDVVQQDVVESAKKAVAQLGDVDVVVALAQFPLAEDARRLLEQVPEITVVLREENEFIQEGNDVTTIADGRFAVAPEGNYGSVARINFMKNEQGKWIAVHREIQVDEHVAEDQQLAVFAQTYMDKLDNRLAEKVACSDKMLKKPHEIGQVAALAFRKAADADAGWVNAGGLRSDLPAGELTMKDILAVFPYDNKVMKIEVTGAQLRQALEQGGDSSPEGNGGGYPILAGVTYVYDSAQMPGAKIRDLKRSDGTIIESTDKFTLAITNYVVNGGNNVVAFRDAKIIVDAGFVGSDFDALVNFLTTTASFGQDASHVEVPAETAGGESHEDSSSSDNRVGQGNVLEKTVSHQAGKLADTGLSLMNIGLCCVVLMVSALGLRLFHTYFDTMSNTGQYT